MTNTQRSILIAATILAGALAAARSDAFTGADIKKMCATQETDLACMTYIRGAMDATVLTQARSTDNPEVCMVGTMKDSLKLTRVGVANNNMDGLPAGFVVGMILRAAFPCVAI